MTAATSGIMISGCGSPPGGDPVGRRLEDRADLHLEQPRDDDAEPDAAQAEHRVLLVQPLHSVEQLLVVPVEVVLVLLQGDLDRELGVVGQELVQRRVDQPDRDRQPVHRLEDPAEVVALQRQQRRQRGLLTGLVLGDDEVLHELAPLAEEHVLGPAQADALGAEPAGPRRVLGGVGVGAHPESAYVVGVLHHPVDGLHEVLVDMLALEVAHHRPSR